MDVHVPKRWSYGSDRSPIGLVLLDWLGLARLDHQLGWSQFFEILWPRHKTIDGWSQAAAYHCPSTTEFHGKWPCWTGKSSMNGPFSTAMLYYQMVIGIPALHEIQHPLWIHSSWILRRSISSKIILGTPYPSGFDRNYLQQHSDMI